ncbi:MAG TPA: pantoate--beta-alanine ligase [Methyloceanibacter sp.]|nr:pantoate--beta-alanine ligase [Methyloceanibacter sp.]
MVAAGDALMSTFAVRTVTDLRQSLAPWRKAGERIALVPTMGALHDGHLSLVALAKSNAARVVASIFVNPTQFGPREDFNRYPRDEAGDLLKLDAAGANLVFVPETAEMYPHGFSTNVGVSDLTEDLCGASRPNHFDGVATVVTKLLLQCAPDLALFGEKDYQQLLMIKRLVRDLDIPVEILGGPIVREKDGLALSSRNAYLSPSERKTAPLLYQTIVAVANDLRQGRGADDAAAAGRFKLEAAGFQVDYVAVRDPETLKPLSGPVERARVLAAVQLGRTRLIDNVAVPAPTNR